MGIAYIPEEAFDALFDYIGRRFSQRESVPHYRREPRFNEFCGVLKQVEQNQYYPDLLAKAVYLLIGINKGHFFSNGNKRIALTITLFFLLLNYFDLKDESKTWYQNYLQELFPEFNKWEDFPDFTSTDFATYNLSIIIADSEVYGIKHDDLKERTRLFFEGSIKEFKD